MIGQSISHYRILEKLGEGGMGVVYKAEDTKLSRPVALKFLPPHLLASDTDRQRFLNEAQTAARLSHPGICTVYEIDTIGEHTFIAMEFIQGEDLAHEIASGPLEFERAAEIALDLCGALREAHASGVIHRDIKPSNVMISEKGRTVLLDFGVARLKGDPKVTRTGTMVGTSGYMSPEQVRGETVDHRTDIWSLGVVLYQMLTGQLPFKADHEAAVMYAIANEDAPPISDIRPTVPAALQEIVEKALEKNVADRYHNIDAFQADLEVFLGRQEGKAAPTSVRLGIEEVRRRRFIRAVWAVLLVAVVAAGVWLWPREKPEAPSPIPAAREATTSAKTPDHRASIAVLPLANMSAESGSEFFSDGMTEEIITQLAQIKALKVISRTSVMQYKNTTKKLPVIAGELGVENILEGSVLRAGDRVRISVQLIDGASDEHLWAESYEGDLADILALQRRVAMDVAGEIKIELTPEETRRLSASTVVNKKAYDLYLQGRYQSAKRTPDGMRLAMDYYGQALAIDPRCALAYTGVAETYAVAMSWVFIPTGEACPKARETAEKALSIDPDLAAAHAVLGIVAEICDWDWDAAERHLTRAIELNPGDAYARVWYAQLLETTGHRARAAEEARVASELDPLSVNLNGAVGSVLAQSGEYSEAAALFDRVRGFDPESATLHFYESAAYYLMGDREKAARASLRYGELIAQTDRDREDAAAARKALDEGGPDAYCAAIVSSLKRLDREEQLVSAFYIAVFFARMGEADSAMVWLERAYRRHEGNMYTILWPGTFNSLWSDPRFIDLVGRMRLPLPK
jgi:TolB-like protein/predicted Ser/Thr protein kinase